MIKLIGILVVALGFAFRFNTLLVVMVAGIVTGLVSGMSLNEVMALFGKFFVENRYMSLAIVLSLPVIGVLERYGLKERAEALIRKAKNATTGRVLLTYLLIREASAAIGLNIGGHAQAVRPLIVPMAEGAAVARYGNISEKTRSEIRAYAATAENTGWFFGEDIFIATGAILLMKGFFDSLGMDVDIWDMALWGIPTALAAFFVSWIRFHRLDKRIANDAQNSHAEFVQQDEKGA
ncbi:DUF969 domain-containing protein [Aneurinibacillus thermoaerophilus]|uniref:DUF969 domain-containing protein n=1 Tax=Aneurinibacillus thermoaerophilus TaxID=143495 RepID=A0ABX8YAF2_ANETH|nr:DUF969 domain-containing protein [Aneurinibacillus thermoaerophilus]MED0675393.1 DUF969 domain-containing protein [Aneurinibacillus thermoaerophilus]MED0681187.1 DUF969 domain-containing protein [Aneurinibacillus thermoaerophilus]MED0735427.1 DUF969 domain-containing protein [Aneurinibacillus thermoaerophilus]MED0765123.1 DUF969 domain-containing protein [Aneurinibacillus thermoaerophilus]QYY42691.1 DUF969 domain-containing protein [Aneurinibacillus thermoaerophilus]